MALTAWSRQLLAGRGVLIGGLLVLLDEIY